MNWILTTIGGALVALVLDELFDLLPGLARKIVRSAAHKLPPTQRPRYVNEWLAELEAVPGRRILRLAFAIRLLLGAPRMAEALGASPSRARSRTRRSLDVAVGTAALAFLAPLLVAIAAALKLASPQKSVLGRVPHVRADGRRVDLLQFRTPPTRLGYFLHSSGVYLLPWLWNLVRDGVPPRPTVRQLPRILQEAFWPRSFRR